MDKLKKLFDNKKKVIVHHMDVDGSCSAAQMLKFTEADTYALKDPHLYPELLDFLGRKKPEVVIFVDLSIDQEWKGLIDLKSRMKKTDFVIIDHHFITKDMSKYGFVHINPRFEKEDAYVPASLMVFDILNEMGYPAEKGMWISAIGTISDHGHTTNPKFMKHCKEKYSEFLKGGNIFESSFGIAAKTIYSAIIYKGLAGTKYVIDVLKKSERFENFEKNRNLNEWRKTVDEEIKRVLDDFEKSKKIDGKILFYEVNSTLGVTSIISNYITERYPNYVAVIAKKDETGWKVSSRSPKVKVNLAKIVPKCVEGIGRGGGHERAAGAFVTDIGKFRKRLSEEVNA